MGSKQLAVLDIGSDAVTLVLQDNQFENNFLFKSSAEYAGFQDGEFLDIAGLYLAIDSLIKDCTQKAGKPEKIMVGVPGEFTAVLCKTVETSFGAERQVTAKDADALLHQGNTYDSHPTYKTINASPIYFLGDSRKKTINPVEITTAALSAYISYILCERSFINLFDGIAESLNVEFEYTSSALAEAMFVVPQDMRDKGVILVHVGFISATVSYVKGDGLLYSVSFSLGGGHVAGDLTTCLQIPFDQAVELVSKMNLNLQPGAGDEYTVAVKGEPHSYNILYVNEVAYYRVADIADTVRRALAESKPELPAFTPIVLTGSGLTSTVGAKDILSEITGRSVQIIHSSLLQFNKPAQTAVAGLILLQQQQLSYQKGFINKIKTFFTKFRRNQ